MATHRVSILGGNTNPDTSGDVYLLPYVNTATNLFWKNLFWNFIDSAVDIKLYGTFNVPKNYVTTAKLVVIWTSSVITGDLGIEFGYRAVGGNDAESLDQPTAQEVVNSTDNSPVASNRRREVAITLTSANLAADDTVEFYFARDASADTISGNIQIVDLCFQYTDA